MLHNVVRNVDGPRVSYSVKLSHKEKIKLLIEQRPNSESEFDLLGSRNEVDGYCWVEENFCH